MKKIFKLLPIVSSLGLLAPTTISFLSTSCSNVSYNIRELPVLDKSGNEEFKTKILYKSNSSIPYVSLDEAFKLIKGVHKNYVHDPKFDYSISKDGSNYVVTRENGATLKVNPYLLTLTFDDWGLFICEGTSKPSCAARDYGEYEDYTSTNVHYLAWGKTEYRVKKQAKTVLYLANYGIEMVEYNNELYLPFQTMSDMFLTDAYRPMAVLKDIIISTYDYTFPAGKEYTYPQKILDNKLTIDKELLEFNYKETCFFLDMSYGLMEENKYTSFDDVFSANGWKDRMLKSLKDYEDAMDEFAASVMDDGHSRMLNWSPSTERTGIYTRMEGPCVQKLHSEVTRYRTLRNASTWAEYKKAYDDTTVTDTAIITFDSFSCDDDVDYYEAGKLPEDPNDATDAQALFFSSYKKIAANSNIKNVVVDLSCNGGGDVRTCFIIAGMLSGGEFMNVFKNTVDGSICGHTYYTDANLDHKIDEQDFVLKDKNVYVLTSDYSFSCANMLPTMLFQQPNCHIIGKQSGGGACIVHPSSNVLGQGYRISGPTKAGYLWNGVYYSNDRGIEPQFYVDDSIYYERKQLVDYIKTHQ